MANYNLEMETTTHLRGMSFGDNYMGEFVLDVPKHKVGLLATDGFYDTESEGPSPLIERLILIDTDKVFMKLAICVVTSVDSEGRPHTYDMFSIPFVPRLAAIMEHDGYITSDEAKMLVDKTGHFTSTAKEYNSLLALKDREKPDGTVGNLPVYPDRSLIMPKDLFPYSLPLLGLYDKNMDYDAFVEETRKSESLVEWQQHSSFDFILRMDRLSRDGLIDLFRTYYGYLQWRNS